MVKISAPDEREASNRAHALHAESIKNVLKPLYQGQKLTVQYFEREDIINPDEHHIVARKPVLGFFLPFGGKIICRYMHMTLFPGVCHVSDEVVRRVLIENGLFTSDLVKVVKM